MSRSWELRPKCASREPFPIGRSRDTLRHYRVPVCPWEIGTPIVTMSFMGSAAKIDTLEVRSGKRADAIDITDRVQQVVRESGVQTGLCQVYVPHTTAGVFINEQPGADALPDTLQPLEARVPWENGDRHAEAHAAAHIKATPVGTSQVVPVRNGRL